MLSLATTLISTTSNQKPKLTPHQPPSLPSLPMASSSSPFFPLTFLVLLLLSTTTFSESGRSQRGPTGSDHNATAAFLTPHNKAREEASVPPLSWSSNLTRSASLLARYQRDNSRCGFADLSSSAFGANQALANYHITPAEVVASWVAEKKWYTYENNTCASGHECGTYTQVVWKKTTKVGCAQASCTGGDTISICFYYPHGNIIGRKPF